MQYHSKKLHYYDTISTPGYELNCELWIMSGELWVMNDEWWVVNGELWVVNYELQKKAASVMRQLFFCFGLWLHLWMGYNYQQDLFIRPLGNS